MRLYFSLSDFQLRHFDRSEPRFTDIIDGLPPEMASGIEWRLVADINLVWLEKVLQKAISGPVESEERLGQAVLFYFHLRSLVSGDGVDLLPEIFEQPQTGEL